MAQVDSKFPSCPRTQLGFWESTMISCGKTAGMADRNSRNSTSNSRKHVHTQKHKCARPQNGASSITAQAPESHTAEHRPKATSCPGPGALHRELC